MKCALLVMLMTVVHAKETTNTEKFFFTQQPVDARVEEDQTHKMFCNVGRSPVPVTYTWYKSDQFLGLKTITDDQLTPIAGEESSVLLFAPLKKEHTGYYHCTVHSDKFKIYSNTAHLKVTYFNALPLTISSETITESVDKFYLECNTPQSEPLTDIKWYKLNEKTNELSEVFDSRMFIFPKQYDFQKNNIQRGTLLILNVKKADGGLYKCKTTYNNKIKELSEVTVRVTAGVNPTYITPQFPYISDTELNVQTGGKVTMVCAGSGYPEPTIEWSFNGARVSDGDSIFLEDNSRRLVVDNVNKEGEYQCKLSNVDQTNKDRKTSFYVTVVENIEASKNIEIHAKPESYVLFPNRYEPFTLNCSVRDTGIIMLWLKDGKPRDYNYRIKVDDSSTELPGQVKIKNMNLIFETPNESDLGVYQCILYNSDSLKEETAYVTLEVNETQWEREQKPEYQLVTTPKTVDMAEEHCRDIFDDGEGHLVSIMNNGENEIVKGIMTAHKVEAVWIGLTRENPQVEGFWKWTQPGDLSTVYSNWKEDKPDNIYGRQEYAIIRNNTALWEDVSNEVKHPFICKRYVTTCESVDDFYEGRVSVRGWEMSDTKYEVGETIDIYCTDITVKVEVTEVTCSSTGTFTPAKIDCPQISAGCVCRGKMVLSLLSLLLVSLLTSS